MLADTFDPVGFSDPPVGSPRCHVSRDEARSGWEPNEFEIALRTQGLLSRRVDAFQAVTVTVIRHWTAILTGTCGAGATAVPYRAI